MRSPGSVAQPGADKSAPARPTLTRHDATAGASQRTARALHWSRRCRRRQPRYHPGCRTLQAELTTALARDRSRRPANPVFAPRSVNRPQHNQTARNIDAGHQAFVVQHASRYPDERARRAEYRSTGSTQELGADCSDSRDTAKRTDASQSTGRGAGDASGASGRARRGRSRTGASQHSADRRAVERRCGSRACASGDRGDCVQACTGRPSPDDTRSGRRGKPKLDVPFYYELPFSVRKACRRCA